MAWLLCDQIGDGSEADPFRPAVADYGPGWSTTVTLEQRNLCVVNAAWQAAFDSDARIRKITKALLAQYVPDDGEDDGEESPALALKAVRRVILENLLGADDFGDFDGLTVGDVPQAKRNRLITKLDARGLDRSGIGLQTSIQDAIRQLLPQIPARVLARAVGRRGSFTDDFSGEASAVDLASHTPSGGTAWTRVDGSADMAQVGTAGILVNNTTNSLGAAYQCDDQGSANHYVQFTNKVAATVGPFICNRLTDRSNYIGVRCRGNDTVELYKRDAGSFTLLGSATSAADDGDGVRLESDGNAHEVYADTGTGYASIIGPTNDSFNNTETRQGVNARSESTIAWLDDFEAGTLGGGTTATGAITLPGLQVAAQGAAPFVGSGAITMSRGIIAATALETIPSSAALALAMTALDASGSHASGGITLVGGDAVSADDGSNPSLTLPGGIAEGDVVYVGGTAYNGSLDGIANVLTSGYTKISTQTIGALSGGCHAVFRKVMGATPDASVSCQGSSSTIAASYACLVLRGGDIGTPEDVTPTTAGGSSSDPDPPSIDPVTDDCAVIVFACEFNSNGSYAAPSGYSGLESAGTSASLFSTSEGAAWKLLSGSAAEDPGAFDITPDPSAGWGAISVAVKPLDNAATATSALALPNPQIAAQGAAPFVGSGAVAVPRSTIATTALETIPSSAALALAASEVDASGSHYEPPSGAGVLALTRLSLAGTGLESIPSTSAVDLAALVISASAGGSEYTSAAALALSALQLSASGEEEAAAQAAVELHAAVVSAAATMSQPISSSGAIVLSAIILSAVGQGPSLSGGPVPAIISGLVKSLVSNLHQPVTREES